MTAPRVEPPLPPVQRDRNRWLLVLILVLFLGSALIAGALRFSGWRPAGMQNRGELLNPPADLRGQTLRLSDGTVYDWRPVERHWRILVAPPADCASDCVELSRQLDLVWQLFGRNADRVDILWVGEVPEGAIRNSAWRVVEADRNLRATLPRVDGGTGEADNGVPAYVVDPNGFVILRYAPGFDPGDLRGDMAKLLKLR
ncbi:hypothetical protein CNR27_03500 [Luteimonas chenhongjianii]|uniref:Thioredoxin domain-containing protein n=1 Tax=Luteimonas chenhongjianii TaxID=2006110 RepID=A0A290XC30_9GAMM|nr:hypothetical protein [Luteimonas chenhongjianii]ATD66631.1 hypothetical protein CNR27_03500 [Luteimonas chenhongjianii]